jgi:hypothetical protein
VAILSLLQIARLEKEVKERLKKDMQKKQQDGIVRVLGFLFVYFFFHSCTWFFICVLFSHLCTFFPFVYSFMFVYFFMFVHFFSICVIFGICVISICECTICAI